MILSNNELLVKGPKLKVKEFVIILSQFDDRSYQKWPMYKSVIISLINFMKLTTQGDILCISCSLSFSFRGYDRSHSISCTLSFLTKRDNY